MEKHPVQLVDIEVEQLNITSLDRQGFEGKEYAKDFTYSVAHTDYDEETKTISVKVEMDVSPENPEEIDRPFSLHISLIGHFRVDPEKFPMDKINHWAANNAPVIILPYIREHAYSLSMRAGFEPIIFPLIQVPTIKVVKK